MKKHARIVRWWHANRDIAWIPLMALTLGFQLGVLAGLIGS